MTEQKPLKVVVATRLYVPEVGAAAFRLKALVDGLVEQGAEVTVLTTKLPAGSPVFKPSYKLKRWPVLRDAGGYVRGYVQYLSFDIPAFFRLLGTPADVVVSEPPPTTGVVVALSSLIRRRPYVYYAADIWSEALSAMDVSPIVKKVLGAVEGFVLRRAAQVIAVSEPVAEQVAKFGVPASRIAVAGNGVDTNIFTPIGERAAAAAPYFIYTGTMSEWQGADIFIKALVLVRKQFPDVDIRFFGQGTDEDHLKDTANELVPGGVHFGGVVAPAEAAQWIRGAAGALVSIKPGQGYDFAKPTKIYAAAGCGVPVVFAGQGAGAEIVEEGGLGIAAGYDPQGVAAAMIELLSSTSSALDQQRRVDWVMENASLAAAGRKAAAVVIGTDV
ncbi:glycosyl transferase family protein [Arthrobacter sp. PAMC 25486]|uniref:glycosyltransferase family 4 protein n=1 Tax=Arthrobacter sp. PAMC 25486 TaxID=1494608 RepID=UPI0005362212|nr:glycosyltransferase family 4 protein [Arthrobacter sp. PAMC 25486]AIY01260.1 glycosyl transferase family protein [Arthrobacter sp. PAMC 25486]